MLTTTLTLCLLSVQPGSDAPPVLASLQTPTPTPTQPSTPTTTAPTMTSPTTTTPPAPPQPTTPTPKQTKKPKKFQQHALNWQPPPGWGTPLVVSFDGGGIDLVDDGGVFAFARGVACRSAWPTARTPWLALDKNGNGVVDDGTELFGSFDGAKDGFAALAAYDDDHDGDVDADDAVFASLRLWRDDGDRVSQPSELTSLAQARITSLSLRSVTAPDLDAFGNGGRERASFVFHDDNGAHEGAVIDLWLKLVPQSATTRP